MPEKGALHKWLANFTIGKGGVLFILLAATLLPLCILSFYNNPIIGDDYATAVIALQKGFFESQKWWYLNWSGRYFANVFLSLNPLVFGAYWAYKLYSIIYLLLLVVATYWLSGKLFKTLDKAGKLGITSLFIFAYIVAMPSLSYGVFMYTVSVSTLLPDIMTLFLLGCIISYYDTLNKKGYFILSCLLLAAIIGCYDISMVFIDIIILIIAVFNILKRRNLFFPLSLLAVSVIFSVISISAPGNAMRGLVYPDAHKLLFSLKESFVWSSYLIYHWLPFMLFIGLLFVDLLSKSPIWDEVADTLLAIPPWLILMVSLALPVIGLFVCFWAMGIYAEPHTRNVIYFYFALGMISFAFSSIAHIKKRYPDFSLPVYIKIPAYLILVYIVFFKTNNITRAYKDITSGIASAYNKEMIGRYTFLTNFKGDSCMIDSIRSITSSFDYRELKRPVNDCAWNHVSFGAYYYHEAFTAKFASAWGYTSFREYYHKKYIGIKGR